MGYARYFPKWQTDFRQFSPCITYDLYERNNLENKWLFILQKYCNASSNWNEQIRKSNNSLISLIDFILIWNRQYWFIFLFSFLQLASCSSPCRTAHTAMPYALSATAAFLLNVPFIKQISSNTACLANKAKPYCLLKIHTINVYLDISTFPKVCTNNFSSQFWPN